MTETEHLQICLDLWNQGKHLHWWSEGYLNLFLNGQINFYNFLWRFVLPDSDNFQVLDCYMNGMALV
jgi:hypothetical protein